jgi:LPXTG-motif cell wall-anchored protein
MQADPLRSRVIGMKGHQMRAVTKIGAVGAVVAGSAALFLGASPASAAECLYPEVGEQCVEVKAITLEPAVLPVAAPTAPVVKEIAVAGKQQLPVTGSDVVYLVAGGVVLIGSGAIMLRRSKVADVN